MNTKTKSLLIIIVFLLIVLMPLTYALIKNKYFTPQTEQAKPVSEPSK